MAGDFDLIRKSGDDMIKICDASEWRTREDQVYAHYRGELRRSAIKLIKQAEEKSLDGAAYTDHFIARAIAVVTRFGTHIACQEFRDSSNVG